MDLGMTGGKHHFAHELGTLLIHTSYWASSYKPENYSFVDYTLDKGYSVFFYDRLGTGQSEK
jgi:hypothetical protein